MPATSSKVTRPCFSVSSLARDLPKPIAPPLPPPCIRFMKKIQTPISRMKGSQTPRKDMNTDCCCFLTFTSTSLAISMSAISSPWGRTVVYCLPSLVRNWISSPSITAEETSSFSTR